MIRRGLHSTYSDYGLVDGCYKHAVRFLTNWSSISFSRTILLHGVDQTHKCLVRRWRYVRVKGN